MEGISARSFINMPLAESGGIGTLLYLYQGETRAGPDDEFAFIRDVAECTRVATERRRAGPHLATLSASLEQQVKDARRPGWKALMSGKNTSISDWKNKLPADGSGCAIDNGWISPVERRVDYEPGDAGRRAGR